MRTLACSALSLLVLGSGCELHPPHAQLRVGVNSFAADVLYGATTPPPVPGGAVIPLTAQLLRQPATAPATVTTAPPGRANVTAFPTFPPLVPTCPAPRTARISSPATPDVAHAPVRREYPFRATILVQGTSATTPRLNFSLGPVPVSETRQVANVVTTSTGTTFDVITRYPLALTTVTTGFHYTASGSTPPSVGATAPVGALQGLAVTKEVTTTPSGTTTYTWTPEMQLLKTPASDAEHWYVAATDPSSGITESYEATVAGRRLVNACGTWLQGWEVRLTNGNVVSGYGASTSTFSADYVFAPQAGGLVLEDTTRSSQTVAGVNVTTTVADAIDVAPSVSGSGR